MKAYADARQRRSATHVSRAQLSVLKTCGSAFKDFHRDKFTTLGDASDRLLATSVLCRYDFGNGVGAHKNASAVYAAVKHLVLEMFAREFSYSVQETLYKMGVRALKELPQLESIYFEMPNIHVTECNCC